MGSSLLIGTVISERSGTFCSNLPIDSTNFAASNRIASFALSDTDDLFQSDSLRQTFDIGLSSVASVSSRIVSSVEFGHSIGVLNSNEFIKTAKLLNSADYSESLIVQKSATVENSRSLVNSLVVSPTSIEVRSDAFYDSNQIEVSNILNPSNVILSTFVFVQSISAQGSESRKDSSQLKISDVMISNTFADTVYLFPSTTLKGTLDRQFLWVHQKSFLLLN
jgi:hypothetical protein